MTAAARERAQSLAALLVHPRGGRVLRLGRRRQDVGRGRGRARAPRHGSAARCSCSPSTRPSASPTRSASRRSATSPAGCRSTRTPSSASSRAASSGRRCSTRSDRGTSWCCATRPTRRPRTASSTTGCTTTSPVASCRATTTSRWSGSTRSTRAASTTSSSSTRRRRGTRSTSSTRPRAWPTSSAAGCCAGSRCRTASANGAAGACSTSRAGPSTRWPIACSAASSSQDIAEFFLNFQSMYDGLRRARAKPSSSCCTTGARRSRSSPRSKPRRCTKPRRSAASSATRDFHLGALVLNKTLPDYLLSPDGDARGRRVLARQRRARAGARGHAATPGARRCRRRPRACCARRRLVPQLRGGREARGRAARRAQARAAVPEVVVTRARVRRPTSPTSRGLGAHRRSTSSRPVHHRYDPLVTTFFEQARTETALWGESLRHVQRLAASWRPLADLSFSDLLLLAPIAGEEGQPFVVLAQVRPTTGQTIYPKDLVGTVVDEVERPLCSRAFRTGEIVEGDTPRSARRNACACSASRCATTASVVALVTRETRPDPRPRRSASSSASTFDVRALRGDDRRRLVPVPPGRRRVRGRARASATA